MTNELQGIGITIVALWAFVGIGFFLILHQLDRIEKKLEVSREGNA